MDFDHGHYFTNCPETTTSHVDLVCTNSLVTRQLQWQPPRRGRVKCNVDASFSHEFNRTEIGICLYDDEGTFVLAKSIHSSPMCSSPMGEALRYTTLRDMSFDNVDFASSRMIPKLL